MRNIFLCLGFQFAGPLAFQEFFHDTVAEWEKRTGKTVRVELATSKDITDAILAAPARARQVAVIDMRYWQYQADGSLFAPPGGQNLAFRELIRKENPRFSDTPPDTTPQQVYRAVREYHDRYPDKAIVAWHGGAGPIPVLMAGGAQAIMQNPSGGHGQGRVLDRTTSRSVCTRTSGGCADEDAAARWRGGRLRIETGAWRTNGATQCCSILYPAIRSNCAKRFPRIITQLCGSTLGQARRRRLRERFRIGLAML